MKSFKDFLKISVKLLLFAPILAFMVYCNYHIDPSGLFFGKGFERIASEYMLDGKYISGYERLDGRKLNEVYAMNVPYAPQVLINGSSRSMTITADMICPNKTFYNASNVGGDRYDFFTSYYIFAKQGKEPETIVLSLDSWLFNPSEEAIDHRSNKQLYYDFLNQELGLTEYTSVPENKEVKYKALFSPSYFQSAIRYYKRDTSQDIMPEIVEGDVHNSTSTVKCPDGSIIYDAAFMNSTKDQIDFALFSATLPHQPLLNMCDFTQLDQEFTNQLELFIEYLQAKGINVVLYLPPYQEFFYSMLVERKDEHPGFFEVEDYCHQLAEKYNIPIYGSYDSANLDLGYDDFLDAFHMRPNSIYKILPVIA